MYIFEPTLEYIQQKANFLKIKENAIPGSGQIPEDYAQLVLTQEIAYIIQQFTFYGLELPTDINNLAVAPAKDLCSLRVIVSLMDSYLNESERAAVWRNKLKDSDLTFKQCCEYFTSQKSSLELVSGVVEIDPVRVIP